MRRQFRTVCISGYFDPLHLGHVEYMRNARLLGDKLVVILNRAVQMRGKRLRFTDEERKTLLESIRYVDEVVFAVDVNDSVCDTLVELKPDIFAKGLTASSSELAICATHDIEVVHNVGKQIHMQDILHEFR